jgi:hypothetical protein
MTKEHGGMAKQRAATTKEHPGITKERVGTTGAREGAMKTGRGRASHPAANPKPASKRSASKSGTITA